MIKLTNEQFVQRAKKIHGDKYDYSECVYEHSLKKVVIVCPLHGRFTIKPSNHINNKQGCWHCGNESAGIKQKKPLEKFLAQAGKKPNSHNYDFSLVRDFKNNRDPVKVICKFHGEYERSPRDILRSNYFGCKKCKIADDTFTKETFVERSILVHGDKYDYDKVDYTRSHDPVTVTCRIHGDFTISPYIHLAGGGFCPKCTDFVSSHEIELAEHLENLGLSVEPQYKKLKGVKEVDLLVRDKNLAIEMDGLYWHSDIFKSRKYHIEKTKKVAQFGLRLVHIFEDEWIDRKEICKSALENIMGLTTSRIHARKCELGCVPSAEARKFLEENHLQGFCPSSHKYGLYDSGRLVSLMTFGPNRVCLGSSPKRSEYELLRFCNLKFHNVAGGASRLFTHFIRTHRPARITSYCDIRWGSGRLYEVLGFKKTKETPPNYFYVRGGKRFGRFGFRKDVLVSKGHDPRKTERQIMREMGYNRIYDCGNMKFEWKSRQK